MAVTISIEITAPTTDDALMSLDAIRERIEQGYTSGEGFDVAGAEEVAYPEGLEEAERRFNEQKGV